MQTDTMHSYLFLYNPTFKIYISGEEIYSYNIHIPELSISHQPNVRHHSPLTLVPGIAARPFRFPKRKDSDATHTLSRRTHLQRRLRLPTTLTRLRHHLTRLLLHRHLPLHLNHLLLLRIRQRPGHTQQQQTRAHDPQRLPAENSTCLQPRCRAGDGGGEGAPLGRWEHVLQCGEAVEEGFAGYVVVGGYADGVRGV